MVAGLYLTEYNINAQPPAACRPQKLSRCSLPAVLKTSQPAQRQLASYSVSHVSCRPYRGVKLEASVRPLAVLRALEREMVQYTDRPPSIVTERIDLSCLNPAECHLRPRAARTGDQRKAAPQRRTQSPEAAPSAPPHTYRQTDTQTHTRSAAEQPPQTLPSQNNLSHAFAAHRKL